MKYLPLLLSVLVFACTTTETVQDSGDRLDDLIVNHTYQNILFTPEYVQIEVDDDMYITVKPVDAVNINELTMVSSRRDGSFEHEAFQEIFDSQQDLSRSEQWYLQEVNSISSRIRNSERISEEMGRNLLLRIWNGTAAGRDGSEIRTQIGFKNSPTYNPFYINGNYASVFQIVIENRSSSASSIGIDNFQIASGNEIIKPYRLDFLKLRSGSDYKKLENAIRYSLPDNLIIPSGQKVIKYIATLAVSYRENSIIVDFIRSVENVHRFEFTPKTHRETSKITMRQFVIEPTNYYYSNISRSHDDYFYSIELEDGTSFSLIENRFFVPEDQAHQNLQICAAYITSSRSIDSNYRCTRTNLSTYRDGKITIQI